MFILTMMFITMMINTIFIMMIHPLSITLLIILQILLICPISGPISYSFWFSYILLLIFLGVMLVPFIYITKLASNELFELPTKIILISSALTILILSVLFISTQILPSFTYKYDSLNNNLINISMENNLNQLYNHPNLMLTFTTILYLLLTLIIIVKITCIEEGPLHPSN